MYSKIGPGVYSGTYFLLTQLSGLGEARREIPQVMVELLRLLFLSLGLQWISGSSKNGFQQEADSAVLV